MTVLPLGLLLGVDSLVVGLALGALQPSRSRHRCLALSFALCDGLASLLGGTSQAAQWRAYLEWCGWLGPAAVVGYGVLVLSLAWCGSRLAEARGSGLVLLLPLGLSVDNLVAGIGAKTAFVAATLTALAFATASGGLAYLGLVLGAGVAERTRPRSDWLAGSGLLVVAAALALKEMLT